MTQNSSQTRPEKELTGRHVLFILLGFFGVMIAVNAYFTIVAVKTFRGEDVPQSYRQGLEYNQTIAARLAQKDIGWSARINITEQGDGSQRLILQIEDKAGQAIDGAVISAVLRHPVDSAKDKVIALKDTGAGRYSADLGHISGQWSLNATVNRDDVSFKVTQDLWVK
jgi:nitrogen fixation protein FixH